MPHRCSTVIAVLLSLSGFTLAQSFPDAPSATSSVPSSTLVASKPKTSGAWAAARGPWLDTRNADVSYWNSTAALFGTTILNVELTARCAEQHTCLTSIAPYSTRGELYAYTLPTDVALSILSLKLKNGHRWWMIPQVTFTAGNLFSAGRSYGRLH